MKTFLSFAAIVLSLAVASAQPSVPSTVTSPQAVTSTTTTTATAAPNEVSGTIVSYDGTAGLLVVHVPNVTAPFTYKTNTSTVLVDYANKPVEIAQLQAGLPVTTFFDPAAPTVATKVVLRQYTKSP